MISCPVSSLSCKLFTFMTAAIYYPYFSSGTPTTWTSTISCNLLLRYSYIYLGYTFQPPRIIMSLLRPTMVKNPSSLSTPKSPDFIHPSIIFFSLAASSSQYPCITAQPFKINQPGVFNGQTLLLLSTILAYNPFKIVPTVVVLLRKVLDGLVWKETGEVYVIPQQFVISFILSTYNIFFISTSGAKDPAIMPVLKVSILYLVGFAQQTLRYSENIVGTPYSEVHPYLLTDYRALVGSKPWQTQVSDPPLVSAARLPITIPKQ